MITEIKSGETETDDLAFYGQRVDNLVLAGDVHIYVVGGTTEGEHSAAVHSLLLLLNP